MDSSGYSEIGEGDDWASTAVVSDEVVVVAPETACNAAAFSAFAVLIRFRVKPDNAMNAQVASTSTVLRIMGRVY